MAKKKEFDIERIGLFVVLKIAEIISVVFLYKFLRNFGYWVACQKGWLLGRRVHK